MTLNKTPDYAAIGISWTSPVSSPPAKGRSRSPSSTIAEASFFESFRKASTTSLAAPIATINLPSSVNESVHQHRARDQSVYGVDTLAVIVANDPRPIRIRQEHIVKLGKKADTGRRRGIWPWCIRKVEQFLSRFVAEAAECWPQLIDDLVQTSETTPGLHIHDRGWTEPGQIAQYEAIDRDVALERSSEPVLRRCVHRLALDSPDAARRNLYERC